MSKLLLKLIFSAMLAGLSTQVTPAQEPTIQARTSIFSELVDVIRSKYDLKMTFLGILQPTTTLTAVDEQSLPNMADCKVELRRAENFPWMSELLKRISSISTEKLAGPVTYECGIIFEDKTGKKLGALYFSRGGEVISMNGTSFNSDKRLYQWLMTKFAMYPTMQSQLGDR